MRVLWILVITRVLTQAQVVWTPIYFEGNNQVDMWTARAEGCRCSFDLSRQDCACCVKEGGCQCGLQSPSRCSQCGIHQYCNNMCNITLSSRNLYEKSRKSHGQIKSPSVEGPAFCWYRLLPDSGQRVEIQIYRLVSVGRFNGTSCVGGFVQLVSGLDSIPRAHDGQICGVDERFAPPVVIFEDRGAATLIFQILERTERSQFLAYFSFTPRNGTQQQPALGFQSRGGRRIEHTECDWVYQDSWCRDSGPCRLATPGYPGLYGPNKLCKYLITTSSSHTRVRIKFHSLSLPPKEHCSTDFVKVYHGSSTSSPVLATLCGNRKQEIVHAGPNLLIQFSSGPLVSPFHYNGFVASLDFVERPTTTQPTVRTTLKSTARTTETTLLRDALWNSTGQPPCELLYYSNQSRNGLFDSRGLLQESQQNCSLVFIGGPTDLVFISLANYNLRSTSCRSLVELYDGFSKNAQARLIKRICSPIAKRTRDNTGRFQDRENYISTSNVLQLNFRRSVPSVSMEDMEYVQGAFLFHDELLQGTPTPSSLCDVEYRSQTSHSRGKLTNPGETEIYWTVDGSLECTQRLVPMENQSVSLNIVSLRRLAADTHCHTECGDGGCKCVTNLLPLEHMDHLQILTDLGQPLCCICGPFQEEWLPVGVRSWLPLRLVYYVARYNWATKGFEYETDYRFQNNYVCGHHVMTQHSGVINSVNMTAPTQLNYFLHQSCTWKLDSNVERQLTIYMFSHQNRPCSAWNLSIHEYYEQGPEHTGKQLHTFCSRDGPKNYTLPFKLNIVIIRLRAMTNTPPQFRIKWRSQVVRANTRTSGYIPTAASSTPRDVTMATALLCLALASLS
uniref:CUB domain-containing protein n=1 Tax=Graphocephala atropunctata TaxID=36148 RepID=A0A1B6MHU7_9HEMI